MPSGKNVELVPTDDIQSVLDIFNKYSQLFNITSAFIYNKEINSFVPDNEHIQLNLNLSTPENIVLFGNMLRELDTIPIPLDNYKRIFISEYDGFDLSDTQCDDLFNSLKRVINNHNLYFDKCHQSKIIRIVNNYTLSNMYSIIVDPVNLVQAQTSVDGTTGPLKKEAEKSNKGMQAKSRTPGSFTNKNESIVENQVGGECIGVCAVGLKTFFGLTQYNNYILNYGTEKQQQRVLLGPDGKGIVIGGKLYRTLANIRCKDPNSLVNKNLSEALANFKHINPSQVTNQDVLNLLNEVNDDNDAALVLSALLSLSTDNAKELTLSKLNASTKTIGMYIYGISIGMDFRDITKLLMSQVGDIINSVLNDNVFTKQEGYARVKEALNYFEYLPNKYLNKFKITRDLNGESIGLSPLEAFILKFQQQEDWIRNKRGELLPFNKAINVFAQDNQTLEEKIKSIEKLRKEYKSPSIYAVEMYQQLIDFIEDYIIQCDIVSKNRRILEDITTLAEGSEEMRRLGAIFGINQGLKNKVDESLRQINNIERAIYDITEDEDDIIDLVKFAFDEDYREECINKYDNIKHTFNILDAVATVPHYLGYIQMLAIDLQAKQSTFKFRSVKNLTLKLSKLLDFKDESRIMKGVQNYIGDYLRKSWMKEKGIQFTIPKGNKAFDKNGNLYTLEYDTPIILGTDWGDATFRMFMELQVIPDLKEGKIKPGLQFVGVSNNKFLMDLGNNLLTNTISKNPTVVYTLPINMLPRTDQEKSLLNSYIAEFNKLARYGYQYEITYYTNEGTEITELTQPLSIVDMFTYYAMIADSWKLSEKSLVPILENFQNTGIIKEFHDYIAQLDKSGEYIRLDNIDETDIYPYVAPYQSPYSSKANYIWYRNPISRKMELMRKVSGQELEWELEVRENQGFNDRLIKEHVFEGNADTNYFPTGKLPIKVIEHSYNDNGNTIHVQIEYDVDSGTIINILVGNKKLNIKGLTRIPTIKEDGVKKVNISLLESIIKSEQNKC